MQAAFEGACATGLLTQAKPMKELYLISGQSWGECYFSTLKVSGCRSIIASVPRQT